MTAVDTVLQVESAVKRHATAGGTTPFELGPISMTIAAGSWMVVTGRSGAGKTTLLQLLAGLDVPDAGRIILGNAASSRHTNAVTARMLRSRAGIIHQQYFFINYLPVWQNVTLRFIPEGMPSTQRRERAATVLSQLQIVDMLDRRPDSLSGGERQRVAIARAIVHEPRLLLADEPTSDVDAETARLIVNCFAQQRSKGAAVVVATHDPALCDAAERRMNLHAGRVTAE